MVEGGGCVREEGWKGGWVEGVFVPAAQRFGEYDI